ncbi:hypothetical protein BASA81_003299 [Batrachochytrium salamandrivorans]|nr:hypothetical protein BASA81_003299 [Batrachochytrium salamandrivorans]
MLKWICLALVVVATQAHASLFPYGFNPTAPFIDTCLGLGQTACKNSSPRCTWKTSSAPSCVMTAHAKVSPPDTWKTESVNLVSKFFTFQWGSHLTEGKVDRRYYNVEVNECAALCLKSAAGLANYIVNFVGNTDTTYSRRRCLSFDFYPFELPMALPPHAESKTRGICVLNTQSAATARLRTEDTAFTDAELYYLSEASLRPFSSLDGYYEVKDLRGAGMTQLLDFANAKMSTGGEAEVKWGSSRYGMSYLKTPTYPSLATLDCSDTTASARVNDEDVNKTFFGGFTSLTRDGGCPGMISKAAAESMCRDAGGSLCPTQTVVKSLDNTQLGCSLDGQNIWSAADVQTTGLTKYARCCGTYVDPPDCTLYSKANTNFCASKLTSSECIAYGSGYSSQMTMGFGKRLTEYRSLCEKAMATGMVTNCRQLLVQAWEERDNCVWCPGLEQCRPGSDFGICDVSTTAVRSGFSLKLLAYCSQSSICDLAAKTGYSDLATLFSPKTDDSTSAPAVGKTSAPAPSGTCTFVPCENVKGNYARAVCFSRKDCQWKRKQGQLSKTCHTK